jgi:16S rRNA (cytosine967-C5)-methyltransferase
MNIRQIALRILDEYEAGGKFINLALSSHLTDKLSREEKAALTALLYTSVERKLTYDYYICALAGRSEEDIDPHTKNILRLGLCQLIDMHSIPDFAAVNETVKLAEGKGERAFVNGILRAAARQKDNMPCPKEEKNYRRYLSVKYSFPLATVKHFDALYGREDTESLLVFFNNEKYTDITVNTLKISVEEYKAQLMKKGITVEENPLVSSSLRIRESVNPERLYGFKEGYFFVQDRASAVASAILRVGEDDLVVDCCSAPGGKSFASAILSGDKAEIHSFDLHESKLSLIESGRDRLGLSSIVVDARDALTPDDQLLFRADKVICDAPCSGLGVLGKKPDLRYKDSSVMTELPPLQYNILTASSKYLKVGGELVYSTCTLNPDENELIVEKFLSENSGFEAVPFTVGNLESKNGMLTLLPHIHGTDGFFIAKIRRKA